MCRLRMEKYTVDGNWKTYPWMPIVPVLRLLQKQANSGRTQVCSAVLHNGKWYLNVEGIRILVINTSSRALPYVVAPFAAAIVAIATYSFVSAVYTLGTASSSIAACISGRARTLVTKINAGDWMQLEGDPSPR